MDDSGHLGVSICLLWKDDARTFHLILLKVISDCIPWWQEGKRVISHYFTCGFALPFLPRVSLAWWFSSLYLPICSFIQPVCLFNKYLTFVHQVPGAILGFGSRTVNYTDNALLSRSQHFSKGKKTTYGTDIFWLEFFKNPDPWKKSTFRGLVKYAEPDS